MLLRMMFRPRSVLLMGGVVLMLQGCGGVPAANGEVPASEQILETHRVQNEELRGLMRSLDGMVNDTSRSELERDDARRRYAFGLAENLEAIGAKLKALPGAPEAAMNPEEAARFRSHADALLEKGRRIGSLAEAYATERLEPEVDAMLRTCNACHRTFAPAVPPVARRW